ncbi:MAG TPA: tRNA 2-thiouridine(34) synthase MnmA [Actinomycetota bacterium]|nr:tRNA 2-thiouridine(34) synthase MnmA [Actinomycetota bacterium]
MSKRAVVAMSGGVDSSVAAALLVEAGHDVTGIMLKLWSDDGANSNSGCCNVGAADDARRVADVLDIPFYCLNMAEHFERTVVRDFHAAYSEGRTPNPCVRCNQWVKFDALLERARALGADILATGHYARVDQYGGRWRLRRGVDPSKDQSYVLWMLTQDKLRQCAFPVGDLHKTETRAIAERLGLRTAAKPDSQEICFVRDGDFGSYAREHIPAAARPGRIVDSTGRTLGTHEGIGRYTVGQRRGLGVSLGMPVFVTGIDAAENILRVGPKEELRVGTAILDEVSFTGAVPNAAERVLVQCRAHGDVFAARLRPDAHRLILDFEEPPDALAPGQSAVLFSGPAGDEVVGGGIVASTIPVGVEGPLVPALADQ